jgi:hypothetical protein
MKVVVAHMKVVVARTPVVVARTPVVVARTPVVVADRRGVAADRRAARPGAEEAEVNRAPIHPPVGRVVAGRRVHSEAECSR